MHMVVVDKQNVVKHPGGEEFMNHHDLFILFPHLQSLWKNNCLGLCVITERQWFIYETHFVPTELFEQYNVDVLAS